MNRNNQLIKHHVNLLINQKIQPTKSPVVEVIKIKPNNLIDTIPVWGPSYECRFQLKIDKYRKRKNLLFFGTQKRGDGIPDISTSSWRRIVVTTILDSRKYKIKIRTKIKLRSWHTVFITLSEKNGLVQDRFKIDKLRTFYFQFHFYVYYNEALVKRIPCKNPVTYRNIQVYASNGAGGSINAYIQNLVYTETEETTTTTTTTTTIPATTSRKEQEGELRTEKTNLMSI